MLIRISRSFVYVMCLTVLLVLCFIEAYALESSGSTTESRKVRLTLDNVIRDVVRRNSNVKYDFLQTQIANETVKAEKSIYQPVLQTSMNSQSNSIQNSTDDLLVRVSTNYQELNNMLDLGVNGIVPSGAQWDVKLVNTQKNSTSIDRYRSSKYEDNANLRL